MGRGAAGRKGCTPACGGDRGSCAALPSQGTAASTKNKLPSLITSMETVGAKALEDFADNIKVTPLLPLQGHLAVGPSGRRLRAVRSAGRMTPVSTHCLPLWGFQA